MEEASTAVRLHAGRRPQRLLRLAGDERLVALVRAGDERAFELLYDRHHRPILSFCRHMLGSREEAEDALQQTFLSAYRDLTGSTKAVQPRPWLFAIARNRCLSMLRARCTHAPLESAEPSTEGLAATVERREDVRELLADVARLPEDQRAALLLAELGALDHAGIATVLGCRREQVKALVFQARSSLAADRQARATPCEDVRAQLAVATGGALRRAALRRHLDVCSGCRTFKTEVTRQRQLLAVALPVVPTALLKGGALPFGAAAGAASGGAAAGVAGTVAATGGTAAGGGLLAVGATGVTKVVLAVTMAGAVAGGGALTVKTVGDDGAGISHRAPTATPPSSAPVPPPSALRERLLPGTAMVRPSSRPASTLPARPPQAQGFVPTPQPGAGGNGAAARSFARTRGSGGGIGAAQSNGPSHGRGAQSRGRPATPPATSRRSGAEAPAGTPPAQGAPTDEKLEGDKPKSEHKPAKAPASGPAGSQTDG